MINTYGYDSVDGEDCTNTWYDFTGESYSWGSANTSIATLANPQTHFVGVGSTSGYAHVQLEGTHLCNTTVFQPQSPQNTVKVQITAADVTQNKITVVLSGSSGVSGNLNVKVTGANNQPPVDPITNGTAGPGTYNYSFNLGNIPIGEYTTVTATWTVNGAYATATFGDHFKVLGTYVQTQYNTPAERSYGGSAEAVTIWNCSCASFGGSLLSNFVFRVSGRTTGTGRGYSINYNVVKPEQYCTGYSTTNFRENAALVDALGGPLNGSTVAAWSSSELAVNGTRVFIVGEGIKTVTDLCPACCSDVTHLDNYSTSTVCSGLGSLPSALTIRLY